MKWTRVLLSLALVCLGAGMMVYGAVFHSLTVLEEEETEVSIPIPAPFAPPMPSDDGFQPVDPFDQGMHPPGQDPFAPRDPFAPMDEFDPAPGEGENPFEPGASPPEATEQDPFAGQELPDELPPEEPWFPDPHGMMHETVTRIDFVEHVEPEWVLVREVTVGGVARLENGKLKRTYSGKPPALCPT